MAEITLSIKTQSPAETATIKNALQSIAENFNKENQLEIAKLSKLPNANERLKTLFNNPLFKMAVR